MVLNEQLNYVVKIFENPYVAIGSAVFVGLLIGLFILSPILGYFENKASNRKLKHVVHFFNTLRKISIIFGIVLLLNILNLLPIELGLKGKFILSLKVLNAIILTFLASEVLVFIYDKYSRRKIDNKVSSLFHIIIRLLVFSAGILVISSILKYDIQALLAALGVGGLAVALALQDTLSNLFSGMQILASKQLKPGDYVKVEDDVEGYVVDINWRNTSLRTLLDNIIVVPNSKISSTITTNYSSSQKSLYFKVLVGVHYDSDLEFVEKVTLEVANDILRKYPSIPKSYKPRVRYCEFADSSINFYVWLASNSYENEFPIKHHFIKELHKRYKKEGIEIPFPIRTIYMHKDD